MVEIAVTPSTNNDGLGGSALGSGTEDGDTTAVALRDTTASEDAPRPGIASAETGTGRFPLRRAAPAPGTESLTVRASAAVGFEARAGPVRAAPGAGEPLTDESGDSCVPEPAASAAAIAHPVDIAVPIPRATASPPTRPIDRESFIHPLKTARKINTDSKSRLNEFRSAGHRPRRRIRDRVGSVRDQARTGRGRACGCFCRSVVSRPVLEPPRGRLRGARSR